MTQYVRLSQTDQNWEFEKILWWMVEVSGDIRYTHLVTNMELVLDNNKYSSLVNEGDI